MKIKQITLETCHTATGAVVAIDVVRAFTTAAYAFAAGATAHYLRRMQPETVTFVVTGMVYGRDGDEDIACADYVTALLRGEQPEAAPFIRRVYESATGHLFTDPTQSGFPRSDLECCVEVDRFDFAMPVERRDGLLVMAAVKG